MSLSSSSFLAGPPTFTLMGETRGGPPTTFHWRRNGVEITNSGSTTISISLKNVEERFTESVYVSTLVVRGNLPGVYQYSVTNRAMTNSREDSFVIEGTLYRLNYLDCIYLIGGASVSNLVGVQNGFSLVLVSWTAPSSAPTRGYQIATANTEDTTTETTHVLTLSQPGNHTVTVQPLSQHLPHQPVSVQVTVRGEIYSIRILRMYYVRMYVCRF